MKRLAVVLAAAASILLILIILFSTLQLVINNETFINNEFTKIGVSDSMGMSNIDLVRSMQRLVGYMEGSVSTIDIEVTVNGEKVQMFELEQEKQHMADVRVLWQSVRQMRDVGLLAMLILYLISVVLGFRYALTTLSKGYLYGAFVTLLFFGFFGAWAALDFSSFWTMFHESLFWNDLWLFDVTTSRMINMLPEQYFADIVGRTAAYTGIAAGSILAAAVFCLVALRRKRDLARAEKLRRKQVKALKAAGLPVGDELLSRKELEARRKKEREAAEQAAREKKAAADAEKRKKEREKAAERDKKRQKSQAALTGALKKAGLVTDGGTAREKTPKEKKAAFTETLKKAGLVTDDAPADKEKRADAKDAEPAPKKRKRDQPFELELPDDDNKL